METALTYPELALHPRPLAGVVYPHPSLEGTYEPGVTEPWIQQVVAGLLLASGASTVLETGGFRGITSAWLALTLERMGGGSLYVADIDLQRANDIGDRLRSLSIPNVQATVHAVDVMRWIPQFNDQTFDLVWLDDDHQDHHVRSEITALWPKMKPGGLIVGHDVWGSCNLQRVFKHFGGYAIDLPRLGPAGGIGIIQIPR
jgi:predicted O-methyltransferase YrrM